MKAVCFLTFVINISIAFKITIPEDIINECPYIMLTNVKHQTILLDLEKGTETTLKDCLLKNIQRSQAVLLLNEVLHNSTIKQLTNTHPNVVIVVKYLNNDLVNTSSLREITKSHSNLLYIIATDRTHSICTDGTFHKSFFTYVQSFFNTLWQKHQILRVVATFPYACQGVYIIYDGKKQRGPDLFDRTIKVLMPNTVDQLNADIMNSGKGLTQGYPLSASIFYRFPTSVLRCDKIRQYVKWNKNITDGFCGLDGLILQDTVNHFKFIVSFPKDEDCTKFGYTDNESGVVTGSLGCVVKKKIDISFNSRFLVLYGNYSLHYLHYIAQDSLCVLIATPDLVPLWYYPYNSYSLFSIVLIISTVVTLCAVTWLSNILKDEVTAPTLCIRFVDYITCLLIGFSIMKHSSFYFLRAVSLCCSIILLAMYQGHINYAFTTVVRYEKFYTLKQLYSSNNILYTTASVRELLKPFEYSTDQIQEDFFKRIKLHQHCNFDIILHKKNVVTLGRKLDATLEIMLKHTDENNKPLIYVLMDCYRNYYLSYIIRDGFPFTKDLKIFMERLLQAGLPNKYYKWTQHSLNIPDVSSQAGPEPRPSKRLTMSDQRVAFSILIIGYIVSAAVFITEKWTEIKNRHKKRLTVTTNCKST